MDYVVFNVIVDDIVFPDGRTQMGVLGGGGPQAAFGMRLWSDSVVLVAAVGSDLPLKVSKDLESLEISLAGLYDLGLPTPRAWQVMEEDGRRTEIWRIPSEAVKASLNCPWMRIPAALQKAEAYHMCLMPLKPAFTFLDDVHTFGSMVSAETSELASRHVTEQELKAFLAHLDVFSPNLSEAESLLGPAAPRDLIRQLIDAGAACVALRMGAEGALLAEARTRQLVYVPAVPTTVIDPIGAGNAFCGGFLVGWRETGDLQTAGLYGAVSASFLVEQIGQPSFSQDICKEAGRRLGQHRSRLAVSILPKG
jgi:sugar/nucleoside kinase (ribokinase family)